MLSLTQGLGAKVALRDLGMPKDGIESAADLVVRVRETCGSLVAQGGGEI